MFGNGGLRKGHYFQLTLKIDLKIKIDGTLKSVFAERGRKRPPPWTLPAHGFFLAPLP